MTNGYDVPYDPGITRTVRYLQSCGFMTCDSGDGVSKPDCGVPDADGIVWNLAVPHVFMSVQPEQMIAEAQRLYIEVGAITRIDPDHCTKAPTVRVEGNYNPAENSAFLMLYGFHDAMMIP
jgi:hypothetical protein